MKASLIYCRQFEARLSKVVAEKVVEPQSTNGEKVAEVKEPKKRGRKPNPKKEIPAFVVEKKDIILDFS
jgi:hypothetical protein